MHSTTDPILTLPTVDIRTTSPTTNTISNMPNSSNSSLSRSRSPKVPLPLLPLRLVKRRLLRLLVQVPPLHLLPVAATVQYVFTKVSLKNGLPLLTRYDIGPTATRPVSMSSPSYLKWTTTAKAGGIELLHLGTVADKFTYLLARCNFIAYPYV